MNTIYRRFFFYHYSYATFINEFINFFFLWINKLFYSVMNMIWRLFFYAFYIFPLIAIIVWMDTRWWVSTQAFQWWNPLFAPQSNYIVGLFWSKLLFRQTEKEADIHHYVSCLMAFVCLNAHSHSHIHKRATNRACHLLDS